MSSLRGHWPIVCFFAQEMDLIINGLLVIRQLSLDYLVILRANRVVIWCLCWSVYMPDVSMYVHVHFRLSCWCS